MSVGEYVIEGNESGYGSCGIQGNAGEQFFNMAVDECNVKKTRSTDAVILAVNIIPNRSAKASAYGGVLFQEDFDWPIIVCQCQFYFRANLSIGAAVTFERSNKTSAVLGSSTFNPTLKMYEALPESGRFPRSSTRFFLEASTATPSDVLGLVSCIASPTNSLQDTHAQQVLSNSCPVGPFGWSNHTVDSKNEVRVSMRKFKFAGADTVFLLCTLIRCAASPCGLCQTGQTRRLGMPFTRRLAEPALQTVMRAFSFSPSEAELILPNTLRPSQFVSLLSSSSEAQNIFLLESQHKGMSHVVNANFTLFGFNEHTAIALEESLPIALVDSNIIPKERLKLVRISAVMAKDTVNPSAIEAILIECILTARGLHEAEQSAHRLLGLRNTSSFALAKLFGVNNSELLTLAVDVGPVSEIAILVLAAAADAKPIIIMLSPVIMGAMAVFVVCCICGSLVAFRIFRKRRPPSKDGDSIADPEGSQENFGTCDPTSVGTPVRSFGEDSPSKFGPI